MGGSLGDDTSLTIKISLMLALLSGSLRIYNFSSLRGLIIFSSALRNIDSIVSNESNVPKLTALTTGSNDSITDSTNLS